ncbi:MAG: hypothetical protein K8R90_10735 [Candidatus Cloacimonetes bacterium]|nr:hypothetical protein [Candidatus Cloacimonadota bacterium]
MDDAKREQIVQKYLSKYPGRLRFAGAKHPRIKQIHALRNNLKPNPKRSLVLEGIWALEMAQKTSSPIEAFLFSPEKIYSPEAEKIVDYFVRNAGDSFMISETVFEKASEKDNGQGLIAIVSLPKWSLSDIHPGDTSLIVILDGVEIPGNIGTIFRTLDGVGGDAVFICNRRARLTHPKVIRGSRGSILRLPAIEADTEELIQWLTENGYTIYLTDTDADSYYFEEKYYGRVAFVAGSERYGIAKDWYRPETKLTSIPMLGECDSLNVGISTSIFLYEAGIQLKGLRSR